MRKHPEFHLFPSIWKCFHNRRYYILPEPLYSRIYQENSTGKFVSSNYFAYRTSHYKKKLGGYCYKIFFQLKKFAENHQVKHKTEKILLFVLSFLLTFTHSKQISLVLAFVFSLLTSVFQPVAYVVEVKISSVKS